MRNVQNASQLAVRIHEMTLILVSVSQLRALFLASQALNHDFGWHSEQTPCSEATSQHALGTLTIMRGWQFINLQ